MGIFGRLFKGGLTADWPPSDGRTPPFDLERGALASVRLGEAFGKLRVLGKPDGCDGDPSKKCTLHYDAGGFEVQVKDGLFEAVRFHLSHETTRRKVQPANVRVSGLGVSHATRPDDVKAWLGEPSQVEAGQREVNLLYCRGECWMSLTFDMGEAPGLWNVDIYRVADVPAD